MTPFPIILSAPSGGGKTTITKRLLAERNDIGYSVSATTRAPRPGEVNGRDYHFLSRAEFFRRQEANEFAEWAEVHGNHYGTLRSEVERVLADGRHVIMDIDVQGARQFAAAFPQSVLVFILPPSGQVLVERLASRSTEKPEALALRLRNARDEIAAYDDYHYIVLNDDLGRAVAQVAAIVDAETARRDRNRALRERASEIIAEIEHELDSTRAAGATADA